MTDKQKTLETQLWKPEDDRIMDIAESGGKQAKDTKVTVGFATRTWQGHNHSIGCTKSKIAVDGGVNGKWESYEYR